MTAKFKRLLLIAVLLCAALLFSGCYAQTEELYSLPQLPDEYISLQNRIDMILSSGAVYSAPTSGSNRQSVQMKDINNDGADEIIAFFRVIGDDKPLKICIFNGQDETYSDYVLIEGEGTSIDSISYADMNNDGNSEIIVGWQMSADLKLLNIYTFGDSKQPYVVAETDFSEYRMASMRNTGSSDVLVMRVANTGGNGEVVLYSLMEDGEIVTSSSYMSSGIESISRANIGGLRGGAQALFVESYLKSGEIVTDIFAFKEDVLTNIAYDSNSSISDETVRTYEIYSADINKNGIVEVPSPVALKSQTETNYWAMEWYSYALYGDRVYELTTYHNYSDGWYLEIPDSWVDDLTLHREDSPYGERTVIFSIIDEKTEKVTDVLAIYTLTGDNKLERSVSGNRFRLKTEGDVIYSAEILTGKGIYMLGLNEDLVRESFNIIYSEWITGKI